MSPWSVSCWKSIARDHLRLTSADFFAIARKPVDSDKHFRAPGPKSSETSIESRIEAVRRFTRFDTKTIGALHALTNFFTGRGGHSQGGDSRLGPTEQAGNNILISASAGLARGSGPLRRRSSGDPKTG